MAEKKCGEDDSFAGDREPVRCVKELGFVGVKITPIGHVVHPATRVLIYNYTTFISRPVLIISSTIPNGLS